MSLRQYARARADAAAAAAAAAQTAADAAALLASDAGYTGVWVPSSDFRAYNGVPETNGNSQWPGMRLDKDTAEGLSVLLALPRPMRAVQVDVYFTAWITGTGVVVLELGVGDSALLAGDTVTTPATVYPLELSPAANLGIAQNAAGTIVLNNHLVRHFTVRRDAANVADTYTQDVVFLGLFFRGVDP